MSDLIIIEYRYMQCRPQYAKDSNLICVQSDYITQIHLIMIEIVIELSFIHSIMVKTIF